MNTNKVRISFKQALEMLIPYAKAKIIEQIKSVMLIIIYLIFFQTMVLGIGLADAAVIAFGISMVIIGLAFFMEGLMLGLMPLGEIIGVKLPQKTHLIIIIGFSFILGVGATFAEPAIGVLKTAGSSVKAWEAPLLYLILNKYSDLLVYSVGAGVGLAVVLGMLRFMYKWSLKPLLYILVPMGIALSAVGLFDENLMNLIGLAWDCGGVTTGPVTVPLVLALGIGICRIVGGSDSGSGGFGVVTLASLLPVVAVISLGLIFTNSVPQPMPEKDFFQSENKKNVINLFQNEDDLTKYALLNSKMSSFISLFGNDKEKAFSYLKDIKSNKEKGIFIFGEKPYSFEIWLQNNADIELINYVYGSMDNLNTVLKKDFETGQDSIDIIDLLKRNSIASVQAILPLTIFMLLVLIFILRDKLPRKDEVFAGIVFGLIGMMIFSIGIELGLAKVGTQVGNMLPSSFKAIEINTEKMAIPNFEPSIVNKSINPDGKTGEFFHISKNNTITEVPFNSASYNPNTKEYTYTPFKGPIFGSEGDLVGLFVVLAFGFLMGYGATLAEPALNALGATVEELTVGTFKKSLLMQTVAIGVGIGIAVGVAKILWNIPLFWLLTPPYILLLVVSKLSTEEFVNIGWDSAGVTTGPITVPLVLAMGLGIGSQVGVIEGFGILANASVYPILCVLTVGLIQQRKKQKMLKENVSKN